MSDISANLHFLSIERRKEYLHELKKLNDQSDKKPAKEKKLIKMKKLESSDEILEANHKANNSDIRNEKESISCKEGDILVFEK